MSWAWYPRVPFSTRNPRIPPSVRAQMMANPAMLPFVIQRLVPFRIQSRPSLRARVCMPAGLEPKSGSVNPKHPITSPLAMAGSHRCFCSSDPYRSMGNMQSDPWTETKLRRPLSPRSSSWQARPYMTLFMPAAP